MINGLGDFFSRKKWAWAASVWQASVWQATPLQTRLAQNIGQKNWPKKLAKNWQKKLAK
jgi:hypothetical protein